MTTFLLLNGRYKGLENETWFNMLILKDTDQTLRMQTDLKMGLPIIIKRGSINYMIFSTESISEENFEKLNLLEGEQPYLCVTGEELKH